ncbi:hypothetical protein T4E_3359 [Trichinella pseudospiralis]|uniref:Uncharacterized protein n=1 Tax=Trichinella pseudospiralis TaxID=6337 RepID=A0A0V0YA62_TRIPS|nr:hypothetical protein T4E_3359 [Trichinella pseudospiralis]
MLSNVEQEDRNAVQEASWNQLRPVLRKCVPTTVLFSSLATLFTSLSSVDWLRCVCFDIDTSSDAGFQQAFSHQIEHDSNAHSWP